MAETKMKMSTGTKVVIGLSVAGILYFLYKRSQANKIDQGGNTVNINVPGGSKPTVSNGGVKFPEDMPTNQRNGFLALQKQFNWPDDMMVRYFDHFQWKMLAQAKGNTL